MHKVTFFPIGNADSFLVETANGKRILFDYAHWRTGEDESDRRIDLSSALPSALGDVRTLDVVAFTHADRDHVSGAKDFFFFDHDPALQAEKRVRMSRLWVPAKFVLEPTADLCEDAQVIRKEARWRLRQGQGVRVFSQPKLLRRWLDQSGIAVTDNLVSDAGTVVPDFNPGN